MTEPMRWRLAGIAILLCGCGGGDRPAAPAKKGMETVPPPKITHFYGNAAVVPKGDVLTLCYGTENAAAVTLTPYEDEVGPSFNRCVSTTPAKDTVYTLTAKGAGGEVRQTFSATVGPAGAKPAAASRAPERQLIQNFNYVGKPTVQRGERVQLCYSTAGASSVSVSPGAGAALRAGSNECFTVTPEKTTTYILTARAADGAVDRMQVTVPVR